jgi:uncharacterized membrane protein YedE/YeeE
VCARKNSFFQLRLEKGNVEFVFCGGYVVGWFYCGAIFARSRTNQGVRNFDQLLPSDIFSWESLFTLRGFIFIVVGGFLVGFGTRYAGGCTSGHAIMGLSNLQWPSLVATIMFMIGGIVMTWFILPFLLGL